MRVAVPGGELHVEERGEGFPLLLVQGLGYAVWAWRFQLEGLGERLHVFAFDNRGTGRSFKPPGPYSIEQLADEAAALLDALGIERAHVLGHSMGGYISQTLALRRPDLVRSLILSGTGPGAPTHEPIPGDTLRQWLAHANLPPEDYVRRTMHLSFARDWPEANAVLWEELIRARLEFPTPPEAWRAQFDACVRFVDAVELFSHVANLGDTRSLIIHSASTTHRQLTPAQQEAAGAGPDVVRLSIGIETPEDLIRDLEQALAKVAG